MIISFILGGLGNQLFQYAIGRQLALTQNVPLKLETVGYKFPKYSHHPYLLDKFNIIADRARPLDYLSLATRTLTGRVVAWEKPGVNLLDLRNGAFLVGYWQNLKYLKGVADVLRQELTLRHPPSALTLQMAEFIQAREAVSVHVRRTDYVTKPKNTAIFAECSLDYYREGMKVIGQHVSSPHFFVFSDDHVWTKQNIKSEFPITFVTHNDVRMGHEDLMLMRQCKHHIIANSTFSWWGAWLSDAPNKTVVAPRNWFKDGRRRKDELLLAEWIEL